MSTPASARTFVKVMAFMCLGLGVPSMLANLLSIVHLLLVPDGDPATLQGILGVPMPPQFAWMFRHTLALSLANGALSLLFVCVGSGLWHQREWARRGIIALLLAVTIVSLAALPLIGPLFDGVMMLLPPEMITTPDITTQLHTARLAVWGIGGVAAIAMVALHGWLIWRFQTPEIRAQFH
ncbi:hypothetical protein FUT69_10495 [Xylella taiwanensis]|uniref:Uncharacterized protein n=1 Tax=Xylella taiwanensis TaxID=1444770 RepID=Z9JMP4_9GAMM|nr:hypothetical protein [Xylella taiwanensis]AXI82486.1 hypothetical protein AB672_00070 [Xylella taiwanensis]EWS79278.1 hypothetical protein AF72_00080 [Xylella taiwanensis]MCD8455478.1 hypothetical protein [Xylella taiwanensis]MCD8457883.1 hypothetical protein [Xylella taiwanensis]MCD8460018.1 hypothetical protein [Xylella taiwanensis]